MKLKPLHILLPVALIVLIACNKQAETERSFCYWKTTLDFTQSEDSMMKQLGIDHLYIRFFDVDWNPYEQLALPMASIHYRWDGKIPVNKFTPSVFITNLVFEKASTNQLDTLAKNISKRVNMIINEFAENFGYECMHNYMSENNLGYIESTQRIRDSILIVNKAMFTKLYDEILIDCDWTVKTRENYFYFLNQLKKEFKGIEITATLRLWQYKYREKAGIPPVNRCLLMCYSLESPGNYEVNNSICSKKDIELYTQGISYPKKIDLALPVFSWSVLFRGGRYKGLISEANSCDYNSDSNTFKKISNNRYTLQKDTVIENYYFRYGDEIRVEEVDPAELEQISIYLGKKMKSDRITFFSWDTVYLKRYGIENLKKYYQILGN